MCSILDNLSVYIQFKSVGTFNNALLSLYLFIQSSDVEDADDDEPMMDLEGMKRLNQGKVSTNDPQFGLGWNSKKKSSQLR